MQRPITRYDLLLVAIAVPVVAAALLGTTFSIDLSTALAFGSLPASAGIGYAIAAVPPTEDAAQRQG